MRYYLYINKTFLQSLFASIPESNFNLEIIEYSLQKGETIVKDINVAPKISNAIDNTNWQKCDKSDEKMECSKNVSGGAGFFAGERNTSNIVMERRYINIEDVSGIKNLSFYNQLIVDLEARCKETDRLCIAKGKMFPCRLRNIYEDLDEKGKKDNQFFCINNKYIWLDNNCLESDLGVLSTLVSEVTVLGYSINKTRDMEIIKAIAIYIE